MSTLTPFVISSQDQSVVYLNYIFGTVGSVLTPQTAAASSANGILSSIPGAVAPQMSSPIAVIGIMAVLFKALNTAILTLGVLVVIYTTVMGLLATAHEGEFMGKKWNGPWVPLRTIAGIALMFPVSSGYSAIQIIIMWIVLQGVGAADVLWTTVINYVSVAGSVTNTISVSAQGQGGTSQITVPIAMKTLFPALVCQASARAVPASATASYPAAYSDCVPGQSTTTPSLFGAPPVITCNQYHYYCGNPQTSTVAGSFCQINSDKDMFNVIDGPQTSPVPSASGSSAPAQIKYNIGPNGACGSLVYTDPAPLCATSQTSVNPAPLPFAPAGAPVNKNQLACITAQAGQQALQTIVPVLGTIAKEFVTIDHDYLYFYENPGTPAPPWIQTYCSAQSPPIGSNECCVPPSSSTTPSLCTTSVTFPLDYIAGANTNSNTTPVNDYTNTSTAALQTLYEPNGLTPYLGNNTDFIDAASNEYSAALATAVAAYFSTNSNTITLNAALSKEQATGWLLAGAYYYSLASTSYNNAIAASPSLSATSTDPKSNATVMTPFRNNVTQINTLLTDMSPTPAGSGGGPAPPAQVSEASGALSSVQSSIVSIFSSALNGGTASGGIITAPLANIASLGFNLMLISQVIVAVFLVIVFAAIALGKINFIALGFGMTEEPIGAALQSLVIFTLPLLMALIGSLFVLGAMLGIYVPMIPYILFTAGAIGWFMAVIEAMVAGPLIALGILSPHGQHEILGRAEQSIFMLLNLFLRPGLMIVGMISAMLLSGAVVTMINSAFLIVVNSISSAGGNNPGLFEGIIFIAVYTSLIVTSLNKVFSLIYVVPERITTWIGGHAVQYGEGESLGQIKQAAESAAGGIEKAAGAGQTAMQQAQGQTRRAPRGGSPPSGGAGPG